MSFYVYLASNSSKKYFEKNTLTNYTTRLNSMIELDCKYEVGLVELMYPLNWKFIDYGSLIITNVKTAETKKYSISFNVMENIDEILRNLNSKIVKDLMKIFFEYDRVSKKISINMEPDYELEFLNEFHLELGFRASKFEAPPISHKYTAFESIPDQLNNIKALFIYSDICEKQHVGDSMSQLLRTVCVENNHKFGDYINSIFTQPHYVPVNKNTFQTIEIQICDDTGSKVHFSSGKIIAKLHFRKILNFF